MDLFERRFEFEAAVDRFETDDAVGAGLYSAFCHQVDGKINGARALVKEKERRYINCAAGEIDPRRG
jgi:phage/plasmid primase-like uncharacterized protein